MKRSINFGIVSDAHRRSRRLEEANRDKYTLQRPNPVEETGTNSFLEALGFDCGDMNRLALGFSGRLINVNEDFFKLGTLVYIDHLLGEDAIRNISPDESPILKRDVTACMEILMQTWREGGEEYLRTMLSARSDLAPIALKSVSILEQLAQNAKTQETRTALESRVYSLKKHVGGMPVVLNTIMLSY